MNVQRWSGSGFIIRCAIKKLLKFFNKSNFGTITIVYFISEATFSFHATSELKFDMKSPPPSRKRKNVGKDRSRKTKTKNADCEKNEDDNKALISLKFVDEVKLKQIEDVSKQDGKTNCAAQYEDDKAFLSLEFVDEIQPKQIEDILNQDGRTNCAAENKDNETFISPDVVDEVQLKQIEDVPKDNNKVNKTIDNDTFTSINFEQIEEDEGIISKTITISSDDEKSLITDSDRTLSWSQGDDSDDSQIF